METSAAEPPFLRRLEKIFAFAPGDLGRSVPLFLYLYIVITGYVVAKVARDALFLARFQARQLPYADIATAVLVGAVIAVYVRLGRRMGIRNVLLLSAALFSGTCLIAWAIAVYHPAVWLYPVLYIWVGILGVLAPAQVWTLANYVLTTREARRLFGLIGSGAILGWITAGFASKVLVKSFGALSLLLAAAFLLLVSGILVAYIWRKAGSRVQQCSDWEDDQPRNLHESIRAVLDSSYLRAIAAVIFFSSLVTAIVGWQFKALAQLFFARQDTLAIFFGDFNFYAGILSLAVQLLLTSRVLRRFGLGPALFVVPLALLAGSVSVIAAGTLLSVLFIKGCDQVLRYSIDKSTVELLYLPVTARIKFQVKWFIDTVVWRFGDGLAGGIVLVLTNVFLLSARQVSWVVVALLFGWILAAYFAKRLYAVTLASAISEHRLELASSAAVFDRDTTEMLVSKLSGPEEKDILYALRIFEIERERVAHPAIAGLLDHSSAVVRQKALSILGARRTTSILPKAQSMLRDPDLRVRTEALLFVSHFAHTDPLQQIEELGQFEDYSIRSAIIAYLAHPGEAENRDAARTMLAVLAKEQDMTERVEAARLIGTLPPLFTEIHRALLSDPEVTVATEAIHSAAALTCPELVRDLINLLSRPEVADPACQALAEYGQYLIPMVGECLGCADTPIVVRRQLPSVLAGLPTPRAVVLLENALLDSDTPLRRNALGALNKLLRHHPELQFDSELVENVLISELLGHYRSYQVLFALNSSADENIVNAIQESMAGERERIFRLLSLLYPAHDFEGAYYALQSADPVVHDNALEFLDDVLNPGLREMLVPLLDPQITIAERSLRADSLVHMALNSREDAVEVLIESDDPWLRSCGAYAIGHLGMRSFEARLNRYLDDSDPLLREAVKEAKVRLASAH